eukprot:1166026-Rhodomonas_salina.1
MAALEGKLKSAGWLERRRMCVASGRGRDASVGCVRLGCGCNQNSPKDFPQRETEPDSPTKAECEVGGNLEGSCFCIHGTAGETEEEILSEMATPVMLRRKGRETCRLR